MQEKLSKIIIILLILLSLGYFIYSHIFKENIIIVDSNEDIKKIDSLESVIDSLSLKKELLDKEIDTIYFTIYKNTQKYEENCSVILDNDIIENYEFFSKYVNQYKSRYDSINNF